MTLDTSIHVGQGQVEDTPLANKGGNRWWLDERRDQAIADIENALDVGPAEIHGP